VRDRVERVAVWGVLVAFSAVSWWGFFLGSSSLAAQVDVDTAATLARLTGMTATALGLMMTVRTAVMATRPPVPVRRFPGRR